MDVVAVDAAIEALDKAEFWKKGYAILSNMYTPEEIEELRAATFATRDSGQGGELMTRPGLRHVLTDGRMVRVAQKLLDNDDIVYMGDSSVTLNSNNHGWHKDNTDRLDPKAPDWASSYTQLRFGIYCQDHVTHTGGLNLREGSHDIPNLSDGELIYMQTVPGDLAVWSMRITHSGNGVLLKDPDAPFPDPDDHKNIPPEDIAPADGDRIAVFAHLGANDEHAARYGDYMKTRTYLVNSWRKQPWDDEIRQAAADAGLTLRDLPAEVMDDPTAGLKQKWEPFPYELDGEIVTGSREEQRRAARQAANRAKRAAAKAAEAPTPEPPTAQASMFDRIKRRLKG